MVVNTNEIEREASANRFYRIVLSWDYSRILRENQQENNKKKGKGSVVSLKEVKDTYKDVDDYLSTFEPLLFEEVKGQISKGQEEVSEWEKGMTTECNEVNGFYFPVVLCLKEESVSQNDLLLLANKRTNKEKFEEGKEIPTAYAFALVEHRQHDKIRLRMNLTGEIKGFNVDDFQSCPRLANMNPLITQVKKEFHILKICNLSTIVREYVALRSIISLPFKDLILSGAESNDSSDDRAWKISSLLEDFIETNHNKSQIEAINAGLSRKSFVLIQGPPGTGKTQTILGLLSAILHATPARIHSKGTFSSVKRGPELPIQEKYRHWEKASPWLICNNPRDQIMPVDGDDGFFPSSGNDLKPEVVNSNRKYRVRVLVCAPSNSALDEIVSRVLRTGIRDENNHSYNPKIVRIGLKAHHSVEAVSMDYLVEQKLAGFDFEGSDKTKQGGDLKEKDNIRASILEEAVIVFSTLSYSGSALFSKLNHGFDVVVIDEAAQAVEPATLIPLANGCKQVFLVGDPVQLPATVISPTAKKFGYHTSLFKRFQKAGYPVQILKTQYRMHPEIRSFPSREFYDDALEDGPHVTDQTKRSWHRYSCFGPFTFFDIHEGEEHRPSGSGSCVNVDEVDFVIAMYHTLVTKYPELKESSRIAIISPYKEQVKLFREKYKETFGVASEKFVDINTVDGFQGREKDVAIFSCVRANEDGDTGFLKDYQRMNVGITRARSSILVVGSVSTLKKNDHWKNLIESAEKRNVLMKVSKPYVEFFSDANLKQMEKSIPEKPEIAFDDDDDMQVNRSVYDNNNGNPDEEGGGEDQDYAWVGGEDGGFDGED